MTPIRIQVLYCVNMKKSRTNPITDAVLVVLFGPDWRVLTGTGVAWSTAAA